MFSSLPPLAALPGGPPWLIWAGAIAGAFVLILVVLLIAMSKFYKKTTADSAFVRTGSGGRKVVIDGGVMVIPLFHRITEINLESLRLLVSRSGSKDALIAKDKFRVDIEVEFYIRVEPDQEHVLRAARSLGDKSLTPSNVKQLVEAKLVGALRTVAATKEMMDLHTNRQDFEDAVQEMLRFDLEKNGLTLESVAITHLDQTPVEALDDNNVFDAVGLKLIANTTERARKEKNDIQQSAREEINQKNVTTDIAVKKELARNAFENNKVVQERDVMVKRQNIAAEKAKIQADQDLEFAAATKAREVESFEAEQQAETQRFKYEQEEAVRKREIAKQQAVEQADIERQLQVRQADLERNILIVQKERQAEEARITKELAVEQAEVAKRIGIINKVQEQEHAEATKLATVAEREAAEQNVLTVQETAEAERARQVAVIQRRAQAEQDQLQKQIAADAAAYEVQREAEARAKAAELQAAAIERLATAKLREAEALAEGERKLIDAKNQTANPILVQEAALKLLDQAPEIVRELMKPAEKISEIKVLNLAGGGFNGNGGGAGGNGTHGEGSLVGKIVGSVLEAGAAYPLLKEMLKFAQVDLEQTSVQELVTKAADVVKTAAAPQTPQTAAVAGKVASTSKKKA